MALLVAELKETFQLPIKSDGKNTLADVANIQQHIIFLCCHLQECYTGTEKFLFSSTVWISLTLMSRKAIEKNSEQF